MSQMTACPICLEDFTEFEADQIVAFKCNTHRGCQPCVAAYAEKCADKMCPFRCVDQESRIADDFVSRADTDLQLLLDATLDFDGRRAQIRHLWQREMAIWRSDWVQLSRNQRQLHGPQWRQRAMDIDSYYQDLLRNFFF